MSIPFDGEAEIRQRLERGQSYGLTKDQYGALANTSMAAFRMCGAEPCEIRMLADAPGCDVTLFASRHMYTLRMEPLKERSTLFALPLDSKLAGCGVELCVHEFRDTDYVGDILAVILHHEGVPLMDCEQASRYVAEQQALNPPRPRRLLE